MPSTRWDRSFISLSLELMLWTRAFLCDTVRRVIIAMIERARFIIRSRAVHCHQRRMILSIIKHASRLRRELIRCLIRHRIGPVGMDFIEDWASDIRSVCTNHGRMKSIKCLCIGFPSRTTPMISSNGPLKVRYSRSMIDTRHRQISTMIHCLSRHHSSISLQKKSFMGSLANLSRRSSLPLFDRYLIIWPKTSSPMLCRLLQKEKCGPDRLSQVTGNISLTPNVDRSIPDPWRSWQLADLVRRCWRTGS